MSRASADATRIIFLGGAGEIGRNMTLFESRGKILVMDTGLMFPTEDMLGVDLVLPDFQYLRERADKVVGVVLTHGHEDHIGGVAYLLKDLNPPIYSARLTLGILRRKLEEHGLIGKAKLNAVEVPGHLTLGPFKLEFFNMVHSIPDAIGTVITTPGGRIFYTGDFKLDPDPIGGRPTDLEGLKDAARVGIDLMLGDSTNAEQPGHTPSERSLAETLNHTILQAKERIIVACFASNLHRVQQIVTAAEGAGRLVSFVGRSMINNVEVARKLGYVKFADSMILSINEAEQCPPQQLVIICTGSQGEPLSALSLMAAREHKSIELAAGDTVVLSATPIPGNESAIRRVIDGLFRIGVEVIAPPAFNVHVSGHAGAEDLKQMLRVIRPKWFVPVHGEYRMLATHARLAHEVGISKQRTALVEDGDVLELSAGQLRKVERISAGYVYVDGLGIGDVEDAVLRDRRLLADDGVIVCVVTIDSQTGELLAGPDITSRGFVFEDQAGQFLEDARSEIRNSMASLAQDGITEWAAVRRAVRKSLGKFVWKKTGRRPIVLPVVMEV